MKKQLLASAIYLALSYSNLIGQSNNNYSKIDLMLVRGEYERVVDTCRLILDSDSLNAEIWFKMGNAYQNYLPDDKSFDCFLRAASIDTANSRYNFMLARGYYGKGKNKQAWDLLEKLSASDSMNWSYAYYLTNIYMQEGKYDESINIYNRFHKNDSSNYLFMDKLGFAYLRKGEYEPGIEYFSKSLQINDKNTNAIKNVAHLYTMTFRSDTAIKILSRGIEIDPSDMDLYVRRASLYFSKNYTKRAMDDYLKILSSGDSSVIFIKRTGIGYANNLQPRMAIKYLMLAYKRDTADTETLSFLAQSYRQLNDLGNSTVYYNKVINALSPAIQRTGITYLMVAENQKQAGLNKAAIDSYLKATVYVNDPNLYMIIGNIYDEKLNNPQKAIYYYQLFLDNLKNARMTFTADYIDAIKKRVEYLKNPEAYKNNPK
jgi:tetratricopeptide (TPR) repeat protein